MAVMARGQQLEEIATESIWRCWHCGQALGVVSEGRLQISHEGRVITASTGGLELDQQCHRCHRANRFAVNLGVNGQKSAS